MVGPIGVIVYPRQSSPPKRIVLVGAGHAHVEVLRAFRRRPPVKARVMVIARHPQTIYSGMLSGLVAGQYLLDDIEIDVRSLAGLVDATLLIDEVVGIDLAGKRVLCRAGPPVAFDLLSLDIGSHASPVDLTASNYTPFVARPADEFLRGFEVLRRRVAARGHQGRVVTVGAGAGGVELLLAIERRLRREAARDGADATGLTFTLVSASDDILPGFPSRFRQHVRALLAQRGIALRSAARVMAASQHGLAIAGQAAVQADDVLWATEATASGWLARTGLLLDGEGFVRVEGTLRSVGRDDVFAAGDTASFDPRPLMKSGVFAVRAGPLLAHNLQASLLGEPLKTFQPQHRALYILSTGDGRAIGTRAGFTVSGRWVWQCKSWIDRRFMARHRGLDSPTLAGGAPGP